MSEVIDFKARRDRKLGDELAALIAFMLGERRGRPAIVTPAPRNGARVSGVFRPWKPAATCSSSSTSSS
jgi:hypothetical protein